MKIALFSFPELTPGKYSIKDTRLDEVFKFARSQKKTYLQIELVAQDALLESDCILTLEEFKADLLLKDLEFLESRLGRSDQPGEQALLKKLKEGLEKEELVSLLPLSAEEKKMILSYGLSTSRPVVFASRQEAEDLDALLQRVLKQAGYISFFTASEKEARAWLIRQGTSAWEAAGQVHTDIQKGFIRAEVISFPDLLQAGGKQQAKMRLEPKEYLMQDGDWANFRFSK